MATIKLGRNILPLAAVIISMLCIFKMPDAVTEGVTQGLKICFNVILPSLFPFMVLSAYIVKSEALSFFYKLFYPLTKFILRQPLCTVPVVIMGLVGGFPVGTKMASLLLERGRITKNQAQRLCLFCVNGGPAFVITAVGVNMLGSSKAGVIIFVSLCISSLILGFATSFFDDKKDLEFHIENSAQSPLAALSASVTDGVQSILGICAWVVLFSGLTECIKSIGISDGAYSGIVSVLEVTKGCTLIAGEMGIPILAAAIGFGGFCVHCQIFSYIKATGLKYSHFFAGRVLCAALSAVICHLLLLVFPVDITTAVMNKDITASAFSVSLPAFIALTIMCIVMIFDIDTKKKIC